MAIKVSAADPNGGKFLGVGKHHVCVEKCEIAKNSDNEGNPQLFVEYVCLASSDPSQVGLKRHDYFSVAGKFAWKFWGFAIACGLLTKEQQEAAHKANEAIEMEEGDFEGQQLMLLVEDETYTSKKLNKEVTEARTKGLYHVSDPAVKDWPKDAESLKLVAGATNGAAGVGAGAAASGKKADELDSF